MRGGKGEGEDIGKKNIDRVGESKERGNNRAWRESERNIEKGKVG